MGPIPLIDKLKVNNKKVLVANYNVIVNSLLIQRIKKIYKA